METSRLMLFVLGNMKAREKQTTGRQNLPRFYKDSDENDHGETIFCKNNVCIYNEKNVPGYLTLKACTINDEYTRIILHWTSNALLEESYVTDDQIRPVLDNSNDDEPFPGVFHIDLTEMKSLKFFFKEDNSSGHFVVGNHENHYKVFHFDLGGMNHLIEIFENWSLCKKIRLPVEEQLRKQAFKIVPIYSIFPNQSFEESRYCPMTKARWKTFLNKTGQVEDVANFRKEVFFGGVFPEVRNEVWPFLLHYYPFHSRTADRKNIKEKKTKEYSALTEKRLNMPKAEYDKFWLNVQCTVDKDVVRTDRSHPYFAGNDNPNVEIMRQILLNYAYYHPEVGYSQGMSDLLASILSTVQDEVDSFWCFVGLMERSLFVTSPKDDSMDCQLLYLKELLRMMAAKFYAHLLLEDENMDLLFCHRWLLLGFKREFSDLHVMRMWEACWSHYQTEFFHIFLSVAILLEYGDPVWQKSMRVDEMLNYFNNLALEMDGDRVLKRARSLLYQFRRLAGIPCTLRGLLSGPGAWDSATLPEIECTCHETNACKYLSSPTRAKTFTEESTEVSDKQNDDEKSFEETKDKGTDSNVSSNGQESKEDEMNSIEQENSMENDEGKCKESQEKCKIVKDETQGLEVEEHFLEPQRTVVNDNFDFNPRKNKDSSVEIQETNEKASLKDEITNEDNRICTCDSNEGDFSREVQQNANRSKSLNEETTREKHEVNNSNSNEDKQSLESKHENTNMSASNAERKRVKGEILYAAFAQY